MKKWQLRAKVYHWFRKVFPVRYFFAEETDNLLDLLERVSNRPRTILDLGTGIGDTLKYLPAGENRILLDFSPDMLAHAVALPGDQKIIGNVLNLPVKQQKFDLITCIGVSEYVREKAVLLQQIYDSLNPEGFAIITFSPKSMITRLRKLLGKKIYPLSGSTAHDLIAARGFYLVWAYKSTMQSQYLVQKL